MSFSDLTGRVLIRVDWRDDEVVFYCLDGSRWRMYHSRRCCETVYLEDVVGDRDDMHGLVVSASEESREVEGDPDASWTFYTLQTERGCCVLRWYGSSNGYYSTDATFERVYN